MTTSTLSSRIDSRLDSGFARLTFCLALIAFLTGFAAAEKALAFGTPTVQIYVGGSNVGELDWSHTGVQQPLPDGACGFRVNGITLLAWGWYEGGDFGTDEMQIANNGVELAPVPSEYLEVTGPFGPSCDNNWYVNTPSTPNGQIPWDAIKLVIQFLDIEDVEFIDVNFDPLPEGGTPMGPDAKFDPCSVPEFCEEPDTPTWPEAELIDTDCLLQWAMGLECDPEQQEADQGADIGFLAAWQLEAATITLEQNGVLYQARNAVNAAASWLNVVAASRDRLVDRAAGRFLSLDESNHIGRYISAVDFAQAGVARCVDSVNRVMDSRDPAGDGTLATAAADCEQARYQMGDVNDAARAYAHLRSDDATVGSSTGTATGSTTGR